MCVFSLCWLCGSAEETGDMSFIETNNKLEQTGFIVIGSGMIWSKFSFIFLQTFSRDDTLQSQDM